MEIAASDILNVSLAVAGWTAFGLAIAVGLALDMVGLFGNWIILAAVAIAWLATGFEHFGPWALVIMAALAGLGELIEFAAAGYGAARFGASKGGIWTTLAGCIVGGILGTPLFPVVGTVIGACVGAFVGAAAYEMLVAERGTSEAMWTGVGAALGKVGGLFGKLLAGFVMLVVAFFTF